MAVYDFLIIGGGHNGLVCACYLAKAGLKVHVIEKREVLGGGCTTEEVTVPGFKHNISGMILSQIGSSGICDDLELTTKYGLNFLSWKEDVIMINPFPKGDNVYIKYKDVNKTANRIEKLFSKKDAKSYLEFYNVGKKLFEMSVGHLAPPLSPKDMAESITGPESEDFWWLSRTNMINVLNEFFEDDLLKGILLWEGQLKGTDPYQFGGAPYCFIPAVMHDVGFNIAEGGSQSLINSLQKCLESHGGTFQVNSDVEQIIVKDGRTTGIKSNDKEINCKKGVISSLNIKALIDHKILDSDYLNKDLLRKIKRLRGGYLSDVSPRIALHQPPKFTCYSDKLPLQQNIGWESIDDAEKFWHGMRIGKPTEIIENIPLYNAIPTLLDPTQAPNGKHTMWFHTYSCLNLKNGKNWDDYKEEYFEIMLERFRQFAPNMTKDNIIGYSVESPLDILRRNPNWVDGYFGALELTPDQTDFLRPTMELSQYKTPVDGLYLTGAGTYPAGGITGVPGHNTAHVILEEIGL